MDRLGKGVSEYPKISIVTIVVITLIALGCIQIFGIDQEFSEESFMPDMELVQASNEISEKYTATSRISILVKSKNDDVLTKNALVDMLEVEKAIVNNSKIIPALETPDMPSINVNSVADIVAQMALSENAMFPTMDEKISAIQNMPDEQIKQLIAGMLSSNQTSPELAGMFTLMLTKDFDPANNVIKAKGTMIIVNMNASLGGGMGHGPMGEESELSKAEWKMDEIVKDAELSSTEMRVMGSSIITDEIMEANTASIMILLPIAFGMVIIILAIIYRSGWDLLFSLLALGSAIIWVFGFGAALGFTFNPLTLAVPVLIVGLGIDYGIHITMRYREEIKSGKNVKRSTSLTIKSVGMALLLATITTVVAFLSNLASPIRLLAEFGILAAIGIIGSFFTMTIFVPACKQLRDLRRLKKGKSLNEVFENNTDNNNNNRKSPKIKSVGVVILNKAMSSGAVAAEHHPVGVLVVVLLVTVGAGWMAFQLETTFSFEDFLPDDLEITKDLEFMMNEFEVPGGEAEKVNILVKGDITDPELLRDLDETISNMKNDESVLKLQGEPDVRSILSLMSDWATNSTAIKPYDNYDTSFENIYRNIMTNGGIPRDGSEPEDIIPLYDWLFRNPKSMKDVQSILHRTNDNNYDGTVLRISVNVDISDDESVETLRSDLENDKKPLDGSADSSIVTSGPILTKTIMDSMNDSQILSLIITIIVSLIILTLVFWYKWRSFVLGAITITPVIFCVIWTLGTMYLVGISLNVMTITIASLTVGLGITYGIHLTHRFLEDLKRHDTIDAACRSTVSHTGTALFGAALTTIAGFGILMFALLPPLQQFGGITAMTILYSFLASVFILPTFLVLWARYRKKRGQLKLGESEEKMVRKKKVKKK